MNEYAAYLFDADGTLIDTTKLIVECYRQTLPHFGYKVPDDKTIISHIGIPLLTQVRHYTGDISNEIAEDIYSFYRDLQFNIFTDYISLCPGTLCALEKLKSAGKKLAVVTSRSRWSLDIYLKHLNIYDYFDFTITPDDVTNAKPDPEPTQLALKKSKSAPHEALFIGDAVYDCMSANAAGVDFAYVNWSHTPSEKFSGITWSLDTLTDLLISNTCPGPVV